MFTNILGGGSGENDSKDLASIPSSENAMAAASSFLKQATETIASNIENPPSFTLASSSYNSNATTANLVETTKKIATFPLVDDDAGLLLSPY